MIPVTLNVDMRQDVWVIPYITSLRRQESNVSYDGYHPVYIPTQEDDSVKEYLRMRDDHKLALKKVKQQINTFCFRHGYHYEKTKWTIAHLKWLKQLEMPDLYRETMDGYMASYDGQTAKIERFDSWIEEIAAQERHQEKVRKLVCFLGIKTHTALSLIVESGNFERFAKGNIYAAYPGLAPGERSNSDNINRLGITKAGNRHLRLLLIESAGGICKGSVGHKSKDLRQRQKYLKRAVITSRFELSASNLCAHVKP